MDHPRDGSHVAVPGSNLMTMSRRDALKLPLSATVLAGLATVSASIASQKASADGLQSTEVNVKDYGATGGGTTNDTAAIHAARDAAGVGGEVAFPAGTYMVDGLTASVPSQTWRLSSGAVVKVDVGSATSGVTVTAQNVSIVGGVIDASNGSVRDWTQHGIQALDGAHGFTLRNATVQNSPKHGVYTVNCKRVRISDCAFTDSYDAGIFVHNSMPSPSNISDVIATGNWIETSSVRPSGICVRGESHTRTVSRVTIRGNTVIMTDAPEGVDSGACLVTHGDDYVVDGNVFQGGYWGISNESPRRAKISNNIIRDFSNVGMELAGICLNTSVTGNSIDASKVSAGAGIAFNPSPVGSAVTNLTVSGNSITGFLLDGQSCGIVFGDGNPVTGATITGNVINADVASGNFFGLYFTDVIKNVAVTGNIFDSASTPNSYGISFLGETTGVVVSGNQFSNIATTCLNLSTVAGGTFSDIRFTGNVVRNCGSAIAGGGATAGTNIVTDSASPTTATATPLAPPR